MTRSYHRVSTVVIFEGMEQIVAADVIVSCDLGPHAPKIQETCVQERAPLERASHEMSGFRLGEHKPLRLLAGSASKRHRFGSQCLNIRLPRRYLTLNRAFDPEPVRSRPDISDPSVPRNVACGWMLRQL